MVNVGGVEIDIRGDNSQFKREMRETQRIARTSGQRVSQSFDRANRSVTVLNNSLIRSRTSMLALGAAAGIALTSATRLIANFEQSMSTVRAVTGATAEQFEALTARARELGATTRFTASQAADGMIELARAGFSVDEVLGSVEGTLKLAQAGALDLGRAAEITASTLRGMQLDVDQTSRVVDVLAAAANSSNTNVSGLGNALKFVTPIAAGLNVSLEETTGAIQALSDAGLKGELAGTGLRKVMISLEKQSNQGIEILAKYGLTLEDVSVSSNGLVPALEKLAAAGITTGEAMTLFGLRGGPAFEVLRSSVPKVEAATKALERAGGTADQIAEVMDDNLNGAILRAVSALQELVLSLGETGPADQLEASLKGLADLLRVAAANADIVSIAFVALSARALLPLALSVVPRAAASIAVLGAQLNLIAFKAGGVAAASTAMGAALSAIGGPATVAIVAAAAAFVRLGRDAERGREAITAVSQSIEETKRILEETDKFDTFGNLADSAEGTIPIFNAVRDAISEVSKALDDVTISGFINEATSVFSQLETARANLENLSAERERLLQRYGTAIKINPAVADEINLPSEADIRRAEQSVAGLEARLRTIGGTVFDDLDLVGAFQRGGLDELQGELRSRLTEINNESIIEAEKKRIEELQEALGNATSDRVRERFMAQIKEAREVIRLLENGVAEGTAREIARENINNTPGKDSSESDRLQEILALEFQLDLARTKGDEAEIARLEDKLDIIARTQDLVRAGLTLADAEVRATEQVLSLREAIVEAAKREREEDALADKLKLNQDKERDFSRNQTRENERRKREQEAAKEAFRASVSDAFLQAVQTGDWQDALGRVFYEVISDNMRDAFDEVLDYLGDALKQVFSGSNGNAIGDIFGGIGDFFGNRASGGSVGAGNRYLIGERGPEMFIPATDGYVVSNEDLRASGNAGRMSGMGGVGIRMGDINVHGDPSGRTLKLIEEAQRRQAEQLPSLIDQRVQESSTRGRYG